MSQIVSFPEYGFAIMEDDFGRFLVFKDSDKIIPLDD